MRLLAVGDIHGCSTAFRTLLEAVALQPDDTLITLGDYVDRGPDSRGVLVPLLALHATGRLIALRGNHDKLMVEAKRNVDRRLWLSWGGRATLASYGIPNASAATYPQVPEEHWQFLEEK